MDQYWKLIRAVPRFVAKDLDVAADFYAKLGLQSWLQRREGFMILGRDGVELQMNLDTEMVRGKKQSATSD